MRMRIDSFAAKHTEIYTLIEIKHKYHKARTWFYGKSSLMARLPQEKKYKCN